MVRNGSPVVDIRAGYSAQRRNTLWRAQFSDPIGRSSLDVHKQQHLLRQHRKRLRLPNGNALRSRPLLRSGRIALRRADARYARRLAPAALALRRGWVGALAG
jgi:hypothetical protein